MKILRFFYNSLFIYAIMATLGIATGLSGNAVLQGFGVGIADIFIRIFKLLSLPIIVLSIIVTLATQSSSLAFKRIWQRTIVYTFGTTVIAACISALLYMIIKPASISGACPADMQPVATNTNYWQHLTGIIPANLFAPFIEHNVMAALLIAIIIGLAIRAIDDEKAHAAVVQLTQGIYSIFLVITRTVTVFIPLALYGFITSLVMQLCGGIDLRGLWSYLLVIVLANILQGFIVLPLWLRLNGIAPFDIMRKMMPALSLAFFSKSSAGTLPVTIEKAENAVGISQKVSRFVLPLCTTINMNGCAAFILVTVIYLMQNAGVAITPWTLLTWIAISTIAAVGNAGVPMGCFFLSASLLSGMSIPLTLLGIILPFYSIIDMIETALNVWSDSCVATVIDKQVGQ